ncbi:hypothetical protein SYNPCC7002_A1586 [Picosynechococcus sp. PCC 7002]|nr:hypothetical protein SYNPCC7002_A1586 [Picosynechococcus sp. PCC 7002]
MSSEEDHFSEKIELEVPNPEKYLHADFTGACV